MKSNDHNKILGTVTEERLGKLERAVRHRTLDLTLVAENINDPHNFSAVLRSCDAVGILNVHRVYHSGQPLPRLGKTSSASARKWVNIKSHDSVEACFAQLRQENKKIYTTHMSKESVSLYDLDLTQPLAFVFGNEHSGVSETAHRLADQNFIIPQVGMVQSLNISVACAVSLYEAYRQRKNAGLYDAPALAEDTYQEVLREWVQK